MGLGGNSSGSGPQGEIHIQSATNELNSLQQKKNNREDNQAKEEIKTFEQTQAC